MRKPKLKFTIRQRTRDAYLSFVSDVSFETIPRYKALLDAAFLDKKFKRKFNESKKKHRNQLGI